MIIFNTLPATASHLAITLQLPYVYGGWTHGACLRFGSFYGDISGVMLNMSKR